MHLWHLLLLLLLLGARCNDDCASGARIAMIAVLYSGSGRSNYASIGQETRRTSDMWLTQLQPHIALNGGIGDTDIVPQLVYCDVQSSATVAVQCLRNLTATYSLSAIVAPEAELAAVLAPLVDAAGIPMIASVSGLSSLFLCDARLLPPCAQPTGRRFQSLIGNGITASQAPAGLFSFLHSYAASTVAIIMGPDVFNSEGGNATVREALRNRFRVVLHITLPEDNSRAMGYSHLMYEAGIGVVQQLIQLDPDVVVWINRPFCQEMADAFWDAAYYPRALVSTQCIEAAYALSESGRERLRYTMGINTWFTKVTGADYSDDPTITYANRFPPITNAQGDIISSAVQFAASYQNVTGRPAGSTQAGIYAGFYVIEAALAISNSTDPQAIMQGITSINLRSFKGVLQIDSNHMINQGGSLFTQLSAAGSVEIVYPSSTWTASLLYPAPSFRDRFYTSKPFDTPIEWAVLALCLLWSVGALYYFGAMVKLRHLHPVRALHWQLSCVSLVGVLVSSLSPLTWTVHNVEAQCRARLWMWTMGSVLMFSPLVTVLLRIAMLVRDTSMRGATAARGTVGARLLLLVQAAQLLLWISLILAWHLAAPFRLTRSHVDLLRPALDTTDCTSSGWKTFGVAAAVMLLLLQILVGVASWGIRRGAHSRDSHFERFRTVLSASFVWVTLLSVMGFLQATASSSTAPTFLFGIRSVLLLLANASYVALLFAPPVQAARRLYSHAEKERALPPPLPLQLRSSVRGNVSVYPSSPTLPRVAEPTPVVPEPFQPAVQAVVLLHPGAAAVPNSPPCNPSSDLSRETDSPLSSSHNQSLELDPPATRLTLIKLE